MSLTGPACFSRWLTFVSVFSLSGSLMLFAAGCGGDDQAGTTSDSGGSSASTATASTATASTETASGTADQAKPAADVTTKSDDAAQPSQPAQPPATAGADKTNKVDKAEKAKPAAGGAAGTLVGRVILEGAAPSSPLLVKAGDESVKDKEVCAAQDVPDESLLVGEGGGLANVFIYMRKAPKGFKADAPAEPLVLDQKGCRFFPHAAIAQVGQTVQIVSDDDAQHNVHTFPKRNQGINVLVNPRDRKGIEIVYKTAEAEPFRIKCDIHAWMSCYQVVVDHPFAAVTDADGNFRIDGIPAGKHEFRVWHEKGSFLERKLEVEVKPGDTTELQLKFAADKFAGTPAPIRTIVLNSASR